MDFHDELNEIRRRAGLQEQQFRGGYFWGEVHFDGFLYHATSPERLPSILSQGITPRPHVSYWGVELIADYFAEEYVHPGKFINPVIFKVDISRFDERHLVPDIPGLQEPISTVISMDDEEVWELWQTTNQTWEDSLKIIGSVGYEATLRLTKNDILFQ